MLIAIDETLLCKLLGRVKELLASLRFSAFNKLVGILIKPDAGSKPGVVISAFLSLTPKSEDAVISLLLNVTINQDTTQKYSKITYFSPYLKK